MYQRMVETDFLTETYFKKLLFSDNLTEIEQFIAEYQPPEIRTY